MHISRKDLSSGLACGGLPGGSILVFGIFFLGRMIFVIADALGDTVFMLNTCVCIQMPWLTLYNNLIKDSFLTMPSIIGTVALSQGVWCGKLRMWVVKVSHVGTTCLGDWALINHWTPSSRLSLCGCHHLTHTVI